MGAQNWISGIWEQFIKYKELNEKNTDFQWLDLKPCLFFVLFFNIDAIEEMRIAQVEGKMVYDPGVNKQEE